MYKKFYSTAMCPQRKMIEQRFATIRNAKKIKKPMSAISLFLASIIVVTSLFVSGVLANMIDGGNNVIINNKSYDIKPIHIDNERYLYTKSWYVPLRDIFEALGCSVNYNVSYEKLPLKYELQSFPQYEWWRENLVTDDITSQIYGATTRFNDNMPVVEIISAEGKTFHCQIGCEFYTPFGSCPPPIIIQGKAYVSIALIDGFLTQNSGDLYGSASWDVLKNDAFYMGKVTWDNEKNSLIIDENAVSPFENYNKTLNYLNLEGRSIIQRIESDKYAFCFVENYTNEEYESCIAVDKFTGEIAVMGEIDKSIVHRFIPEFRDDTTFLVNKIIIGENHNNTLELYKEYNVADYEFYCVK